MNSSNATKIGLIGLLGSSFFFSTATTARALADNPGTALSVAAWRIFLGGAGIALFVLFKYGWQSVKKVLKIRVIWLLGTFTFLFQVAMFYAAPKIGVAVGALVAIGSSSFLAGLIAWLSGFGKPTGIWSLSTVVAVFGLTLLTGFNGNLEISGVLAALLAGLMAAIFVVRSIHIIKTFELDGILINGVMMGIGAMIAAPIAIANSNWIISSKEILLIIYLGPIATTLGNIFYGIGLHNLSPGTVATIMMLEPVGATTWGIFILGEKLTRQGLIGCALIIFALGLLAYSESKKHKQFNSVEAGIHA